jgi:cupin fold WbuC family metalloprotein
MRVQTINNEVWIADEEIVRIRDGDVESLKGNLVTAPRGRIRICAHKSADDALHEMLIALKRSVYIRPHKHLNKNESFHIVEGLVDVVVLDDRGAIWDVVEMGDYGSGRAFYYRISAPYYHTLLIRSELLVVHETTTGPFRKQDTEFAVWAPEETDAVAGEKFMRNLSEEVERFVLKAPGRFG